MTTAVATVLPFPSEQSLPTLVERAARTLANAQNAAEILEAREMASFAYDAAKKMARLAKAKKAHDDLIGAVYRAQADALEIEAQAKRRLADEYDAAQADDEVAKPGRPKNVPDGNIFPATAPQLGLSRKDIHDARQIRDAEKIHPGIVRNTLNARVAAGEEPTRAAMRQAIVAAAMSGLRGDGEPTASRKNPHHKPNPAFEAIATLTGRCRAIIELRETVSIETLLSGFLDDGMRARDLRTIRTCRDVLPTFVEDVLD